VSVMSRKMFCDKL